jgi:hypothetical protein
MEVVVDFFTGELYARYYDEEPDVAKQLAFRLGFEGAA